MELLEKAKNQLVLLNKIEQTIQEQLKGAPKEILRVSKSNGVFQYYTFKNGKRTYIPKKQKQLAQAIAQKDYNKKMEMLIKKNIHALKLFTKHYSPQKSENYFQRLPPARKILIKPFFLDKETYAKQWQAQKYEPNRDSPTGNFFTTKDEHVRSKSEVIIANLLNTKGIPYHYETPVKINTSLTLKLVKRLAIYAQKNIFPGKNLILTMETQEQPLNIKDVEKVIDAFLK